MALSRRNGELVIRYEFSACSHVVCKHLARKNVGRELSTPANDWFHEFMTISTQRFNN